MKKYDALIIGGGIYGCLIALYLKTQLKRVAIVEKENNLLKRASLANQARIHNGYHYPRSLTTAIRSRINSAKFIKEFDSAIDKSFKKVYAISSINSKVHSNQFFKFCKLIDAPIKNAPENIKSLFNKDLTEDVFIVREYAFNSLVLRDMLYNKIINANIDLIFNSEITNFKQGPNNVFNITTSTGKIYNSKYLFICAYSQINTLLKRSILPLIELKHEVAEIALIKVPDQLINLGITVMDGPFFSTMPFPALKGHSLSHVRYTPLYSWEDKEIYKNPHELLSKLKPKSNYKFMIADASRFIPLLNDSKYLKSIYEVKTLLPLNEIDDGRPILFKKDYVFNNLYLVLGGKIDNIYDILNALTKIDFTH